MAIAAKTTAITGSTTEATPAAAGSSVGKAAPSSTPSNNIVSNNPNAEVIRGQVFEVGPRYRDLAYIGEGAYGMVV